MEKNQELVTLLRENGQRLRRSKEWIDRNQHWIKRMKLTIADAPDSIAAEIEKTLTPAPVIVGGTVIDTAFTNGDGEIVAVAGDKIEINVTPQSPEDTKTETIEQIADDVAAKIIPGPTPIEPHDKLSIRDAAAYGAMTYNKLTKLVRKGVIKTVPGKTAKAKMILASEIDNYLSTQTDPK